MVGIVLGWLGVVDGITGKGGTGDVDPGKEEEGEVERGGGDGEDSGRYVKNEEVVSSDGSSVMETESGMTLESRSPGEEVGQDQQLQQQQKLQQQQERVGVVEDAPMPLTTEGVHDIRLVPDREDGEEECGKKVKNYALKDSGAVMMDHSSTLKGPENILVDSRDKYSISPCHEKKQVVIALSEDIVVRAVVLGSYEKYSSLVKEFQVLGSQLYPTEEWMDLGAFTTSGGLGEETFDLVQPAFARYMKFKFITHIGTEYFCTLSQIKVHGITAIESIHRDIAANTEEVREIDKIISAVAAQETIVLNVSGNVAREVVEANATMPAHSLHGSVVHQEQHVAESKQYSDSGGGSIIPEVPAGEFYNIVRGALQETEASSGDTGKTLDAAKADADRNLMAENVVPGSSSLGSYENGNASQHNTSELPIDIEDRGGATPPDPPTLVESSESVGIHDPPLPPLIYHEKIVNNNVTVNNIISVGNEQLHSVDEIGGDAAVFRSTDNTKKTTTGKEAAIEDGGDVFLVKVDGNINVADVQGRKVDGQMGDYDRIVTSDSVVDNDHQNVVFDTYRLSEEATLNRTTTETPKHEQQHNESELKRTASALKNQYILDNNNHVNPLPQEVTGTLKGNLSAYLSQHESKLHTCSNAPGFSEYKTRIMSKVSISDPAMNAVSPYTKALLPVMEKVRNLEVSCRLHELHSERMQDCNQLHSNALFEVNEELVNLRQEINDLKHQQLLVHPTPCVRVPPFLIKVVHNVTYMTNTFGVVPVTVIIFPILLIVGRLITSSIGRKNCLSCRIRKEV